MALNLSKNGVALQAAYDDVVSGKSNTNWALFTYEGNSNDIRLAQKGEGGLEEMVEELSSGKVMYAFCRVQDPNSGLAKYVLVNWTGEGVKDSRKGLCANHVSSMANFLKGAHVTVNARGEDDVEPDTIMGKVAKASGANFNFYKQAESQAYSEAPRGSVGSVYRKTNAVDEIQNTNKDSFWAKAQMDEEVRRKEESKRAEMERQNMEKERKERDDREAEERKKRAKERASQIDQQKTLEKKLEDENREKDTQLKGSVYRKTNAVDEIQNTNKDSFWAKAQMDEEVRRKEESKRAEMERQNMEKERKERDDREAEERKKRTKERASLIDQQKTLEKKLEDENREKDTQLKQQQENVLQKPLNKGINSTASVQKAKEAQSLICQRTFDPKEVFKQRELSFELNKEKSAAAGRPGRLQSPFLFQKSIDQEEPVEIQVPQSPAPVLPESRSPVHSIEASVEEWSDGFEDDEDAENVNQEEPTGQIKMYKSHTLAKAEETEALYENIYESTPTAEEPVADGSDHGLCARTLYDYQAADDSEITFDPDDVITEIDQVDEGWWSGRAPNGHYGMFPANYVELM